MKKSKKQLTKAISVLALLAASTSLAQAQAELSLWYHGAGSANAEEALVNQLVEEFNASQDDWEVVIETFPQLAYNDAVGAAALAGELPDILDVDGPVMPNWAWAGYMQPLGIDEGMLDGYPARHDRALERRTLFRRSLGRRRRHDHTPLNA
jgi:multiple sugar transport system substrate-binding protein